jgi:hypothetical protein
MAGTVKPANPPSTILREIILVEFRWSEIKPQSCYVKPSYSVRRP